MAVARVSPGDPDPVRPTAEGGKDKLGAYPCGARHADDPEIGGVLETAHSSEICRAVTAPITKKSSDLGLPVVHRHLLITIRHM